MSAERRHRRRAGLAGRAMRPSGPLGVAVLALCALVAGLAAIEAPAEVVLQRPLMAGTPYETEYYVKIGDNATGPKVCVIGGVHGNEVAGYLAARKLRDWRITYGTLVLITDAHREAIRHNARGYPGNMNAMFPGNPNGSSMERLAYDIWHMLELHRPGLLVTLHESLGNHKTASWSYGYTLCHDFHVLDPLMQRCIDRANPDILDPRYRFEIFVEPHPTCPTYCAWQKLRIPATSVETCMEEDLQLRVRHQLMACMGFFDEAGLGYEQSDVPYLTTKAQSPWTTLEVWGPYLAAAEAGSATTGPFTRLCVTANVSEAKVYVEGYYKGCTPAPMALQSQPQGRSVRVSVKHDGYRPWEERVWLPPGEHVVSHALLTPLPGPGEVHGAPAG